MAIPSVSDIVRQVGISKSYASEIRSGIRKPSRPLAIRIFRATGWRHDSIAALSDDQLATLEEIEALQ